MEIIRIKAKNFLSFENTEYHINNGVPVLLFGENKTDENQESNGAGKSGLAAIIEYSLLHSTSKKANDKELVRWYQDNDAELELEIHCALRNETLLIERGISIKKGGRSQLSINGVVKYSFTDNMSAEIDKYIISWLGIEKEDLQNFFIISKFKYSSFFEASNTKLIQLIGRFSNSAIIDGIDKDILKEVDLYESRRAELLDAKNRIFGRIDAHKENLLKEQTADKQALVDAAIEAVDVKIIDAGDEINRLNERITIKSNEITNFNDSLKEIVVKLKDSQVQLDQLNKRDSFEERYHDIDVKVSSVKEQKEQVETNLNKLNKDFNETKLILQDIDRNIRGAVTCPNCHHQFLVADEGVNITDERVAYTQTEAIISQLNGLIISTKKSIEEFDPTLNSLKRDRSLIESEENELRTMKRNISNSILNIEREKGQIELNITNTNNSILSTQNQIADIHKRIKELTASKLSITIDSFDNTERIKAIEEEISKCEKEIEQIIFEDDELKSEIVDVKQWAFTFKEFVQYLSVKTLKILQGYANHFLESMRSDLRVELSGFKLKADGTLSDKITAYIMRDGETHDFGSFSGGERARLEAAMILAVSHAINSTNKFGAFNFLLIDEVLESADSRGIATIASSMIPLQKTIILVTHVPVSNYECGSLKIVKENKISKIINS